MCEVTRYYIDREEVEYVVSPNGQWVRFTDFDAQRLRADTAEAERDALRSALAELLDCPYVLEEATIPRGGVEVAPNQVVGTVHISLGRMRKLRAALSTASPATIKPEAGSKPCPHCDGAGSISTGIAEASSTLCNKCDGTGVNP